MPLTMQETFDKVATHLIKQGRQSCGNGVCAYRGEKDLMCAVGVLIPDDLYNEDMEDKDVLNILEDFPYLREVFGATDDDGKMFALLAELQSVHDSQRGLAASRPEADGFVGLFDIDKLKTMLRETAEGFHLSAAALDTP